LHRIHWHPVASPGYEGRGARVGGLGLSPQRGCRAPTMGVSDMGVNEKLLQPERFCLPFTSPSLSSPSSPLEVGPIIVTRESGGVFKLPQSGR